MFPELDKLPYSEKHIMKKEQAEIQTCYLKGKGKAGVELIRPYRAEIRDSDFIPSEPWEILVEPLKADSGRCAIRFHYPGNKYFTVHGLAQDAYRILEAVTLIAQTDILFGFVAIDWDDISSTNAGRNLSFACIQAKTLPELKKKAKECSEQLRSLTTLNLILVFATEDEICGPTGEIVTMFVPQGNPEQVNYLFQLHIAECIKATSDLQQAFILWDGVLG